MSRLVLNKLEQRRFLIEVCEALGVNTEQAGKLVGISGRNYRDWVNGKLLPRKDAVMKLSELSGLPIPTIIEEREEWWSGRVNGKIGGLKRIKKYGVTFTDEDRIKGGHMSQLHRLQDPEYYRKLGCSVPNKFRRPDKSEDLAEFLGIVLGDGGLTRGQCEISLHMIDDIEYSKHVQHLADELFGAKSSISSYPKHNVIKVVISGIMFTQLLEQLGLRRGNKIKHQVDIPGWIKENPVYLRACMRGLYDTDGGTFTHNHVVSGHQYKHFGVTFTSASKPLIKSYGEGLRQNGFAIHAQGVNIFLYGTKVSQRFFDTFKPNNPKSRARLTAYLAEVARVK